MDNYDFLLRNAFDILFLTVMVATVLRSLFNTLLKEMYIFLGLFVSFMIARNFSESKAYIVENIGVPVSISQPIVFVFIFLLIHAVFGMLRLILFQSKRSRTAYSIPLRFVISALEGGIWINVIYIGAGYVSAMAETLRVSALYNVVILINQVTYMIYSRFFTFF